MLKKNKKKPAHIKSHCYKKSLHCKYTVRDSIIYALFLQHCTRGVQKVLQIDIQKIHKELEFDFI